MNNEIYQKARQARDARFDGQFFVAVKSTGIFCRPICPAPSPKEENVEYYELAPLAMQAGYRPCLRCRPDSAPGSFAWKGVDTTVERAVKLLKTFPELTVTQICEKLGITDRYLRDLFTRKIGIAPKKFRLYDQLLFAKNLLHQSQLNIEQVAQASGFASARRLQEHLKANLNLTPSQIRKRAAANNKGVSTTKGTLQLQLAYRAPYNWPHLRDFLRVRAIENVEVVSDNAYGKCFTFGDAKGRFFATHNPNKTCFNIELEIDNLQSIQGVIYHIRRVLDLDTEPEQIHQCLRQAGFTQGAIQTGIRIPGVWSAFEAGCRAILGQQISVKAAVNLVSLLANELGERVQDMLFFPTPELIANSELAFLKMPQKRIQSLRDFAQFHLQYPTETELSKWLSIKGIGPWTVAYAKMRGQSDPDIWLNSDLVIKNQLKTMDVDPARAAPWRSYLTFQLWSMA
ncbi:DNA-3-methyladenine glycosylase 2 family protein [Aliiglaciecola sp. M165]|uniref:DNA-3-methyladenine glycosylase 2 family protein n=1 Tax=Aliiglaciecola sp. M165 TaxID=2593649 RepID=UPI00117D8460|nr:AlkA N-terminal domain-containing protein [Aliiglaciecola sp. M165]TRY33177.1 AraC family transcriptional regulator [Aliiglaciecola sp. M165]